jgi:hypothetical protein
MSSIKLNIIMNSVKSDWKLKFLIKTFATLILLTSVINQVNSVYKYIDITDDKTYFLKYDEIKKSYVEDIKNWSINFSLKGNKKDTEFFCGEKWCFFTNSWKNNIKDGWVISINRDWNKIEIPYEITFNKKSDKILNFLNKNKKINSTQKEWIDITESMLYKTVQKRSLSCEISATADILSYLTWWEIKEDNLLWVLPKSNYNKLPNYKDWKKYWWNPNSWFVWYIDKLPNWTKARQRKMTGYWVLEKPIEKIINNYWFKTKVVTELNYNPNFSKKEHLKLILEELKKWNMVQLWWDICTNPKYYNWKENGCVYKWKPSWDYKRKISWNYINEKWEEKKYVWLNWEHAFYLLGYKWDVENPTHIIVWDTYTKKHTYVTSEWMRNWQKMQYRSIIVYAN